MNLIVPVAGRSSRYPGMRPKWMLTHPSGNLMLIESISGLDLTNVHRIYIVALKEHMEEYECLAGIEESLKAQPWGDKACLVLLDNPTSSQPETVAAAIRQTRMAGPIFIKDADNFFRCDITPGNEIAVHDLSKMELVNPGNKSYVKVNESGGVTNIVEKRIVSSTFCVGGYGFERAADYLEHYEAHKNQKDLYISHIIYSMILDGKMFKTQHVSDYVDWGTLEDWDRFKSDYVTIFTDLDGVLVKNSSKYFKPQWGDSEALHQNVAAMNDLFDTGKATIIITTSRSSSFEEQTIAQLERVGLKYHRIVFDLPHTKRVIINDYAPTNPYRSCDAINIQRNSPELAHKLKSVTADK